MPDKHAHESGDKDGCGSCSPFTTCSTCQGFNFNIPLFNQFSKTPASFFEELIPVYGFSVITGFVTIIWQPPKF